MLLGLTSGHVAAQTTEMTSADKSMQRALDHYHAGKLHEAAGLLRGFIISQPDSELVNTAYYTLAQIHHDLNEPSLAMDYLQKIEGPESPDRQLLGAELYLQLGEPNRTIDQLLDLNYDNWPLPLQQKYYLTLAQAQLELEMPSKALYFYSRAFFLEGEVPPEKILSEIYQLMDDEFSDADLSEAAFMYRGSPVSYLAMLKLGWRLLANGEKELAQNWASAALQAPWGFPYRDEVLSLQSQLTDPGQLQRAIGVLLPLTGRYAAFGNRVKNGMDLALEAFRPNIPVRLIYRDTKGDEETAIQQASELAISDRVMAIAGPLVGNAATGATQQANLLHTPMITMSQREGLAASSLYVYRNSLTPRLQVRALVDYAMEILEITRFGCMYPQTRQGEIFSEIFLDEVTLRGGEVIAQQSYQTNQTDFRYQIRLLQGLDPNIPDEELSSDQENSEQKEKLPPPFEALFIPDYADRVSLIAPQIAFYGLEDIQLLGSSGWNDTELPKLARQFVEGAVFTDSFFLHSHFPFVQDFVEDYLTRFGEEPTILEAQGYDVTGILLTLLNDPLIVTREDLRRALSELKTFPGVTGATRFDMTGEANKVLYLLQIQNGSIIQIN
jgi:ABC-type branched-subunit amino acid transport system substrate-binding protein